MKCLILAAGYATRLYPLTENFPKPLLKVGEKTILDWLIDDLAPLIDEFVVISNHKFAHHFNEWAAANSHKITVLDDGTSSNETRLGAVKDIQFAIDSLHLTDDCMVMAGDNVLDFSLQGFVSFAKSKNTSCVMCHEEHDLARQQRTAIITVDENDKITSYEERSEGAQPPRPAAPPLLLLYKSEDLKRIPEARWKMVRIGRRGLSRLLELQAPMHAYLIRGKTARISAT